MLTPRGYGGIVSFILLWCLLPLGLSLYLPASYLIVLFLVAAYKIHCGNYIVNYVVGYDAPEQYQIDGVPYLWKDPFFYI